MTKCPTCDSPAPHLHPAMQFEGEVQPCRDAFHFQDTPENRRYLPAPAARPEGARELCSACGGNGVLQLRDSSGQRVGVHICPRCKGDCWEATPPPADTAALLADGERLPELIEQRLRDALQDDDLEPWMYPHPGAEAIESLRSWLVAVVRAALTAGASPQETK